MKNSKLIIVVPVFEDSESLLQLLKNFYSIYSDSVYVVAVDDGSVIAPVNIQSFRDIGIKGCVLTLKRNVGHQKAISIGLSYAAEHMSENQKIVVMDSDGEDMPETVQCLTKELNDKIDIAVAARKSRQETLRFKFFYIIYKFIFKLLSDKKINFGNFMAMNYKAAQRLAFMHELGVHVASCALSSRMTMQFVPLNRGSRYAGQSKMNFTGLVLHGFKGLMIFAENVMVRVGIFSAATALLSVVGISAAIILKILGFATPGWFSIALGILFLIFIQTGMLALLTLMMTGLIRSSTSLPPDYKAFINNVSES